MTSADHTHLVHNGKRELTIEELALMQPGMDRLMAEVGPRAHRLFYAAKAGNWRLAEYFFRSVVKQLRLCAAARPKYAEALGSYINDDCEPVRLALRARDLGAFEASYAAMIDRANHWHGEFAKPWIHWVTPSSPPEDLDLTAGLDAP